MFVTGDFFTASFNFIKDLEAGEAVVILKYDFNSSRWK